MNMTSGANAISTAIASMSVSQVIDIAIFAIFGLLTLVGLLMGIIRGFRRQLVRTITVACSAVLAFFATSALENQAAQAFENKTLGQLAAGAIAEDSWIAAIESEALMKLVALPMGILIFPILFVAAFVSISTVIIIIHKILCGILGFTRRANTRFTRFLGMLVGAAQGAFVALLVIMPISCLLSSATDAVDMLKDDYDDTANGRYLIELYDSYAEAIVENPIMKASAAVCKELYYKISVVTIDGVEINAVDSIDGAVALVADIGELSKTDWAYLTKSDKDVLENIKDVATDDPYLTMLVSELLSFVGEFSEDNGGILTFEEPIGSFLNSYLEVLATGNADNLEADLETTLDVVYLLSDNGAIAAVYGGGDVLDSFVAKNSSGKTLFTRLSETLEENPRMRGMASFLNDMAFAMLLESNGSSLATEEVAQNVKTGLNETLAIKREDYDTEAEYRDGVKSNLKQILDSNDIQLADTQLEQITDYVIVDMAGKTELTDSDISGFMSEYYEVYTKNN